MKLTYLTIFEYDLAFTRPFIVSGNALASRQGFIIRLMTDDGIQGYGEVAPLEGFSAETLKHAAHEIQRIKDCINDLYFPQDLSKLRQWCNESFKLNERSSSVRCGVEMALLNVLANQKSIALCELFGYKKRDIVVAGLLQGSIEDIRCQAIDLKAQGCSFYKLKVGNKNLPLDVEKVATVKRIIDDDHLIRLDANQSWTLDEAVIFAKQIGREQIEFIEEPFKDIDQFISFYEQTGLSVAVDESLVACDADVFLNNPAVNTLILKPTLIGGMLRTIDIIKRTQAVQKQVVISSAFESAIGVLALANLASMAKTVSGLGTLAWFDKNVLKDPLIENSVFDHAKLLFDTTQLNESMLLDFDW